MYEKEAVTFKTEIEIDEIWSEFIKPTSLLHYFIFEKNLLLSKLEYTSTLRIAATLGIVNLRFYTRVGLFSYHISHA
jgi:hypothetical protein